MHKIHLDVLDEVGGYACTAEFSFSFAQSVRLATRAMAAKIIYKVLQNGKAVQKNA